MKKMNILIISYYYPPLQSIATNRIYSFAKYLDKEKYNITVLTVDTGTAIDDSHLLEHVEVIRVKEKSLLQKAKFEKPTNFIWHNLKALYNQILQGVLDDEHYGWTKAAIAKARQVVRERQIDIIISSYSPLSAHLIALTIVRENRNIKWIADMRDEMSCNPFLSKVRRVKIKRYENDIMAHADAVTSVSAPIVGQFRSLGKKNTIFQEIRNGYDFEISDVPNSNPIFTILYAGSFYGDCKPDNFLKVLEQVLIHEKIKIKLILAGVVKPLHIPESLKDCIESKGKQPHKEALELMKKADCLLLIIPKNDRKGVYTGKLFEYLGCLRPILALIPENDVAAKLICEVNAGYIAENENPEKIREKILEAYNAWQENRPFTPDIDIIKMQHRKEQVKRLECIIEEIMDKKNAVETNKLF